MKKTLIMLFLFAFVQAGFCEITNEIRYNGRLKGYTVPLGGGNTRQLKFEYFDHATAGKSLGFETHNVIPNDDGVFSVTLKPNIQWNISGKIWIEVSIDGRAMKPREQIMAQPIALHANNGVPPGTVIAFAGDKMPDGYLPCDGTTRGTTEFPELYAAIGSIYGTASGGEFRLPNFQGMFLRGATPNGYSTSTPHPSYPTSTIYKSAPLGQLQGDTIRNIKGEISPSWSGDGSNNHTALFSSSYKDNSREATNNSNGWRMVFDASNVVPTDNENRPANYAVNYYIKY